MTDIDSKKSNISNSPPDQNQQDFSSQIDTKKLFLGIQRHPFIILLSIFLMGLFGLYFSHLLENTYQAEAVLLYQQPQENQAPEKIGDDFTIKNMPLATLLEMITQMSNFETLKKTLGLDLDPLKIKSMVSVPKPKNNSNFIRIIAKTENPHLSINLANSLSNLAIKSSQEFTKKQIKAALESYNAQLKRIEKTTKEEHEQLEAFKKENQYFDMNPEDASFINQLETLKKSRDKTYLEYKSLLTQYTNIKKQIGSFPEYIPGPAEERDNPLNAKIANLQMLLNESQAKYTKNNPKILLLEQELNSLLEKRKNRSGEEVSSNPSVKNELREKLRLELIHLEGKAKSAKKIYEQLEGDTRKLEEELHTYPEKQVALVKLLQTNEITQERLKAAHKAVDSAILMMNHPKGDLELYESAKIAKPWASQPITEIIPIIALLFGAGLGCLLSLLLEFKDNKLRTLKQLEILYSAPTICLIPELRRLNKKNLEAKTLFFTRTIAEYIENHLKKNDQSSIVTFTSSLKGEGKTLFASLTASYFCQFKRKVLLLEMEGGSHPLFEPIPSEQKTLSHYLRKEAELDEIIFPGNYDRINLQNPYLNIKELLKSEKAKVLWQELKKNYSLIIIDAPGLIEEDYAQNLTTLADLSIMIIGSSSTKKSVVDESLRILDKSSSKSFALLLNRVNPIYISDLRVIREMKRRKFFGRIRAWISRCFGYA